MIWNSSEDELVWYFALAAAAAAAATDATAARICCVDFSIFSVIDLASKAWIDLWILGGVVIAGD